MGKGLGFEAGRGKKRSYKIGILLEMNSLSPLYFSRLDGGGLNRVKTVF